MKKILLILLSIPIILNAQFNTKGYNVETGSAYKVIDGSKHYFNQGNDVMMVKFTRKDIIIQKYDINKKKEVHRKEYPSLEKGKSFETILEMGDKYYLIYSSWEKSTETESLHYMPIDFYKGTIGKSVELMAIRGKLSGTLTATGFYKFGVANKYGFHPSFDESKIMIEYRKKPTKIDDDISTDIIGMYVFDADMNKIWGEDVKMPLTEAKMNNLDYSVNSKGTVYMLIDVFDSEVSKLYIKEEKNHHTELLVIDNGEVTRVEVELDDDYRYNNAWLKIDAEDRVTIAGFFYEKEDKVIKDGIYYVRLASDYSSDVISHKFIPLEIVNMYQKERVQEKNKKKQSKGKSVNISNLDLDKTVYLDDGSILLIGEKYYVTTVTTTDSNGRTTTRYIYHYDDILVTKLNSDGEMEWMKKIPKIQKGGAYKGGMSYAYAQHNSNHYFFFVDNLKNIDLPANKRPATHQDGRGGIFTVVEIDNETGEETKNSLFDFKEVNMMGFKKPMNAYQFNIDRVMETNDGIAVEVYKKGKEDIMIQIGIED